MGGKVLIYSWNVNGIRSAAGKGLLEFISASDADLICLQETKAQPEQLPKEILDLRDRSGTAYLPYFMSAKRRGYSGTAIYSRIKPDAVLNLGVGEYDDEGRVCILRFGALDVVSAYFPNSQEGGKRLDYKLGFCQSLRRYADDRLGHGGHLVIAGDYNIAHKPIDLANPESNEGNPGYLPEERAWMDSFIGAGYVDSLRKFESGAGHYTWWTYRVPSARERNIGWRLDYHCVDPALAGAIRAAAIHPSRGGSDHCPVSLELDWE